MTLGLGCAHVTWLAGGGFDFDPDGEPALSILARDEACDFADIVSFPWAESRRIGTWLGVVPCLGMSNVWASRLAPALTVHATAWDWLRAHRDGVVPIDEDRTARAIRDAGHLEVADRELGPRLMSIINSQRPRIHVRASVTTERRVAA